MLKGGNGSEREVSLNTAAQCTEAIIKLGYKITDIDIAKIDLEELYPLYRNRAWILQWFPPEFVHWLFV